MNASAFLDRSTPPTDDDIATVLGMSSARWTRLIRILVDDLGALPALRWDGPRSGWSVAVKRAGKPFVTLIPRLGGFDAVVVLGRAEADAARGVRVGEAVRATFTESPQLHDGRWLFLAIGSDNDLDDLLRLLSVKLPVRLRDRLHRIMEPVPA